MPVYQSIAARLATFGHLTTAHIDLHVAVAVGGVASGNCTEQQIARYFKGGSARGLEPNHRYVQGPAMKAQMAAAGWIAEESAFCVSNDALTRTYPR